MVYVLDSSAFINAISIPDDSVTVPAVYLELKDIRSKELFLSSIKTGKLKLKEPNGTSLKLIQEKAREIGSQTCLSDVDIFVLALAHEVGGILLTDDFTMQNLAAHLGIRFSGVFRGEIHKRKVFK